MAYPIPNSQLRKRGYKVQPRSIQDIRRSAQALRDAMEISSHAAFPIMQFLEKLQANEDIELEIVPDDELKDAALSYPDRRRIKVKMSVYNQACNGDGQARFTLAHELGHLLLHRGEGAFARNGIKTNHKVYEDSEWQADNFAAELLVDSRAVDCIRDTSNTIVAKFQVSHLCATIRLEKLRKD